MANTPKYKEEFVEQARKLCKLGAIDQQLADFFDVSRQAIHDWKVKYPDFKEATEKGKKSADEQVIQSLFKRANGYEYDEKSTAISENGKSKDVKVVTKHVVADTTACIFWLKNRQPRLWRDRQDLSVSNDEDNPLEIKHTYDATKTLDKVKEIVSGVRS